MKTPDTYALPPHAVLALRDDLAPLLLSTRGRIDRPSAAAFGARRSRGGAAASSVGIVTIQGLIARGIWSWLGTDPDEARANVRAAAEDRDTEAIALLVDSPGGTVAGIEELACAVREAGRVKPVAAIAAGEACSAAFWVAAAAGRIIATPSAEIGSVGVYTLHENYSGALAKEGVSVEIIRSSQSPYKTEGNPFEPLGDDGRAWIQSEVDRLAARFISSVARDRSITDATVIARFGGGRVFGAEEAVRRGMADEVAESPEHALGRFAASAGRASASSSRPRPRPLSPADASAFQELLLS